MLWDLIEIHIQVVFALNRKVKSLSPFLKIIIATFCMCICILLIANNMFF